MLVTNGHVNSELKWFVFYLHLCYKSSFNLYVFLRVTVNWEWLYFTTRQVLLKLRVCLIGFRWLQPLTICEWDMGHWTLMHSNCSMISIRLVQSQTSLNGQIRVIIEHWRITGLTIFIKQKPSTLHWECLFASVSFEFIITLSFLRTKQASDWLSICMAGRRSHTRVQG